MSGAEALAIIGCVAAVVSAYHNGSTIVETIKKKRRKRNIPEPTVQLEESLHRGFTDIVTARDDGVNRYGSAFEMGDGVAINALRDLENDLLRAIVGYLARASEDDEVIDFSDVIDTSDRGRIKALAVLYDLYTRIDQARPILSYQFGPLPRPHTRLEQVPETPPTASRVAIALPEVPSQGGRMLQWLPILGPRDRSRSVTSDRIEVPRNELPGRAAAAGRPRNRISLSLPSSTSFFPSSLFGADPRVDDPSTSTVHGNGSTFLRNNTFPFPFRPRSRSLTGSQSASKLIGPSIEPTEYCKGARYLQRGFPKDAFKKGNQAPSWGGKGYYWRCCNNQCVFEGVAVNQNNRLRFNTNVLRNLGDGSIECRWSFFAKSHVCRDKVRGGWTKHTFKCFICYLQSEGHSQSTFEGAQDFLTHTAAHAGQHVCETHVQGRLVIRPEALKGLSEKDAEPFDINILRVPEIETLSPTTADTISPVTEIDMAATLERDDSWYRAQDDTESAMLDPWKDR